ncbi:hypothetical protein J2W27_000512 [Variovorax boronicumulans]|nr:hypothetical protein [Variovorax boronicumulans]
MSAMPMKVRPWNAPENATTPLRPVAARATFIAFSMASAPVVKSALFLALGPGTTRFSCSHSATYSSYGVTWKQVW